MNEHLGYQKSSILGNNSGNSRNGYSKKTIQTNLGQTELTIPRFHAEGKGTGYKIDMIYIGLNRPEYAIERVQNRVLNGGHNIPEIDIERRYIGSLKNLNEAIKLCDTVTIYDNSDSKYKVLLEIKNGKVNFLSDKLPDWLTKVNNQEINKVYGGLGRTGRDEGCM